MSTNLRFFNLICLVVFLSSTLTAQDKNDSLSYLNITTNYDSVYIVIDDGLELPIKVESNELVAIKSGRHSISVVPRFSEPYRFIANFEADSFYVASLSFHSILKEESAVYSNLKSGDSSYVHIKNDPRKLSSFSLNLQTYNKLTYRNRNQNFADYKSSYLKVDTNVDSVYVNILVNGIKNSRQTIKMGNKDSILVRPGFKNIILSHEKSTEFTLGAVFRDSSTTIIKHSFALMDPTIKSLSDNIATAPHYNANLIIISDEDSEIIVNGEYQGNGAVKMNMRTGPVDVSINNKFNIESRFSTEVLNISTEKAIVFEAYTKPERNTSIIYSVIPGASQVYKKQKIKGRFLTGGFILAGVFSLQTNNKYNSELRTFNSLLNEYNNSTNEQETRDLGELVDQQQKVTKKADSKRLAWFTITGAIYAFNLYDALFTKPKGGYRTKTDIDFYLSNEVIDNNRYTTLSLSYDF